MVLAQGFGVDRVPDAVPSAPKGMGGWLLLLVAVLAVYVPYTGLKRVYEGFVVPLRVLPELALNPAWVRYRLAVYVLSVLVCVLCLAAAFALWRFHRPFSVRLAVLTFWLTGPCVLLVQAVAASFVFGIGFPQAIKPFYVETACSAVLCAIWMGYLLKSPRVRNTYYRA